MNQLNGKRVLVTGGNNGLGKEIVEELRASGAIVISYDIEDGNDVTAPRIVNGRLYYTVAADPTPREVPEIDYLINNAGINNIKWMRDETEAEFMETLRVNVWGMFRMTQALMACQEQRPLAVINIVSNAAHVPMRCSAAYNASKGAALILSKQMARELGGEGVKVFSISPALLSDTQMTDFIRERVTKVRGWSMDEALAYEQANLLAGGPIPPAAVARLIRHFLETGDYIYAHGTDIPVSA